MRPPLRWFGGKVRLASRIVAELPAHDHYVEVFAGSAAVLFAKPRSTLETLNDLDDEIVNLYAVLRDDAKACALGRAIDLTPYARIEFSRTRTSPAPVDDVERARRFLVRSQQAVGNNVAGWSYCVKPHSHSGRARAWDALPARIAAAAERLKGVQVDALDWRAVLDRYDGPGVVMYLDPPYHPDVRPNTYGGAWRGYAHELTADDHVELVDRALSLKHASAVVSHYPHAAYERLTDAGWARVQIGTMADSPTTRSQTARVEVLWASHPVQMRLGLGAA